MWTGTGWTELLGSGAAWRREANRRLVAGLGNGVQLGCAEDFVVVRDGFGGGVEGNAAAGALDDQDLSAEEIARKGLQIAADICVYTNDNVIVEKL